MQVRWIPHADFVKIRPVTTCLLPMVEEGTHVMRSAFRWYVLMVVLSVSVPALAQATLSGPVRDDSGAVLPGVSVEASSPALIEQTRSVVTDGTGQYRI